MTQTDSCLLVDVYNARPSFLVAITLVFLVGCSPSPVNPVASVALTPPPVVVLNSLPINAPIPTSTAVARALTSLIHSHELGKHVGVAVADVLTGSVIYIGGSVAPNNQFIPASSIKLFTAAAVLLKNNPEQLLKFKKKTMSLNNLVESTLTESENNGATLLSTLVPGSISSQLATSLPSLDLRDSTLIDASGLSRKDRTTPATLIHLLVLIADPKYPQFSSILSGLPIAGISGTLKTRAITEAGQIRGKTGTLTGVDVLAGYVVDRANRALAFAVMADRVPSTRPARSIIDAIATQLLKLS
jgi:D-alanyl-D-alanine carboxypeptidase